MTHDTPLIAIIAIGLSMAFVLGLVAHRFRLPLIAGYLRRGSSSGRSRRGLSPIRIWRMNWPRSG